MYISSLRTPIGIIKLFFDDEFILIKITNSSAFDITNEKYPQPVCKVINLLNAYFAGKLLKIDYPVLIKNISEFDRKVLNFINQIPFGQTVSYKWVAESLRTSPRAVGQALKRNPFPIIIPCHRIIKSSGELGGYSLGVEAKKWLIEHEKAILYRLRSHKT